MGIFDKIFKRIKEVKQPFINLNTMEKIESDFIIDSNKTYIIDDNASIRFLIDNENIVLINGSNIKKFIFSKQKNNIKKVYIDLTLYEKTSQDNTFGDGIDIFQYLYDIPGIQIKFLTSHNITNDSKYKIYKEKFKHHFNLNLDDYYYSKGIVNYNSL